MNSCIRNRKQGRLSLLFLTCLLLSIATGWTAGLAIAIELPRWYRQRSEDAFQNPLSSRRIAYLGQIRGDFAGLDSARLMIQQGRLAAAREILQRLQAGVWLAPEAGKELGDIAYRQKDTPLAVQYWRSVCERFPYTQAATKAARELARIEKK